MILNLVTPQGPLVEAEVASVTVPGKLGELGILPGHRPMISALSTGILAFEQGKKTTYVATSRGFVEIHDDRITVVAETAELPDHIDLERAKRSLERANKELESLDPFSNEVAWNYAKARQERALNRLSLSRYQTPSALRTQGK